jgi:pyridoxamine 5'-phosphate oxidase
MFKLIKRLLPSKEEVSKPGVLLGQSITLMRREFAGKLFDEKSANPNPVQQFEEWFSKAVQSEKFDPNAMTLTSADTSGRPSARIVLLKEYSDEGFIFYTNYQSRKGRELKENPNACLNFFWPELIRQVLIEGSVEKVSREKSAAYYRKRPRASQLSAWASPQGEIVSSRKELEERFQEMDAKFPDEVPLPPGWGGFILKPERFEFWQGRLNRLHDRICYSPAEDSKWKISRLAP